MENLYMIVEKYRRVPLNKIVSINDLKEMESEGIELSDSQRMAIVNFEQYHRLELSRDVTHEEMLHNYQLLQIIANIRPYQDFL